MILGSIDVIPHQDLKNPLYDGPKGDDPDEFAYGDVRRAFGEFLARVGPERPFMLVGVEQGGTLASRLLRDEIAELRRRLAARPAPQRA